MDNRFSIAIIYQYLPDRLKSDKYFIEALEKIDDNNDLAMIYHYVKNSYESGKKVTISDIYNNCLSDGKTLMGE